mgnify:CR=1 FL=1|jgi:hypothetical protein
MTIRAGGRVALIAATGLLACVVGVSWTVAASSAAETKSESVGTSAKTKQVRYYKRPVHRKYVRTAPRNTEEQKPVRTEAAAGEFPSELSASVANANARMGGAISDDAATAASPSPGAALARDQLLEGQGAVSIQLAEADQLNEIDKAIQEPSQTTVAVAPAKPVASARTVVEDTSTWDRTSLIGKIFIAFGALLTVASAARMFMA